MQTNVLTFFFYWWTASAILCSCDQGISLATTEADVRCLGSAKQALDGRDVVIIAGIGGSGTRGVRHALRVHGPQVLMCNDPRFLNHCGDAIIFHSLRQNVLKLTEKCKGVIQKIMETLPPRTLYFNRSTVGEEIWHRAYDSVACKGVQMLTECTGNFGSTMVEGHSKSKESESGLNLWEGRTWGWKTVKSYFMLPVFHTMFGNRLKFVQVVRDGRDIAYSKNQGHFAGFSQAFYGRDDALKTAPNGMYARQMFWADINKELIEFGRTHIPGRHFVLRMEDLTISEDASKSVLRSLFEFVGGLPPKKNKEAAVDWLEREVATAAKFFLGFKKSYGGNKLDQEEMKARLSKLRLRPGRTRDTYELIGYNVSGYGIASPCLSAPGCGVIS